MQKKMQIGHNLVVNGTFNFLKIALISMKISSIYSCTTLVIIFLKKFKDLYKIKQLPNQSVKDFVKVWKQVATKITILE